ncbi:MAG: hypothetical protein KIT31_10935 [Deltaproteobacteria bacterium]|nr:hypothetical protein [Deltaproteobacteria bacterium]
MLKLLIGILKGAVIGAALGYGAYAAGDVPVLGNPWILYGLIGAVVGMFVGKPIWSILRDKNATNYIAILKAAFGFGIGCGLYAIIAKAWSPTWAISTVSNVFAWPPTLGGLIGALYGGFVELDDAMGDGEPGPKKLPGGAKKKLPAPADE